MRWYKLNPLYSMSKYLGLGIYRLNKDIEYIEKKYKLNGGP